MDCTTVRVRMSVAMGDGVASQRIPVTVAEPACAIRPCLTVDLPAPRRTGDPSMMCEGFLPGYCPGNRPKPDMSLSTSRGIPRRTAALLASGPLAELEGVIQEARQALADLCDTGVSEVAQCPSPTKMSQSNG